DRGRHARRARRAGHRDDRVLGAHRKDRRREDLRLRHRTDDPDPHRRDRQRRDLSQPPRIPTEKSMKSPIRTLALWLALSLAPAAAMAGAPEPQSAAASPTASPTQIAPANASAAPAPTAILLAQAAPAADAQPPQDPPLAVDTSAAAGSGPSVDKGDVAWMMTSTVLVVAMIVPGLALFYGGLMRAKNMLSVLMQVFVV